LFGIAIKPEPVRTVAELLVEVREGSKQVVVARLDDTVDDALKLFDSYDMHHLPVLDAERVVGIVSATDLLRHFARADSAGGSVPVAEVMTTEPEVIEAAAPVHKLVRRLAHAPFRCLPVVQGDCFLDIVTTRDLVRYLESIME
jgi:CBS domain-containing protein